MVSTSDRFSTLFKCFYFINGLIKDVLKNVFIFIYIFKKLFCYLDYKKYGEK